MSENILMHPVTSPLRGEIRPPGSKSLTNRALVTAALASGRSHLTGVLDSQDTRVMVESLRRLGIELSHDQARRTIDITGCAGRPSVAKADLWLENSGTSIRFLTALCCLGTGEYRLDGNTRMRERPIADLISALAALEVAIHCELNNGCPPVVVRATGIRGGTVQIGGEVSSQFLSALLLAAPGASAPLTIQVAGPLVSEPYVDMTIRVCEAFGVEIERPSPGTYRVRPQSYQAREYDIEPDASAASYFLAAAAVTGGEITIPGLSRQSLQGDVGFAEVLRQMGCEVSYGPQSITVRGRPLRGIEVDMNGISDTAQTLAAIAPFASGPTRIRNVAHIRHKETDRVAALATELRRIGQQVEEFPDGLAITPAPVQPATIATYDDHRMAMSFAITGLVAPGITIAHPECTAKTYPRFFDDLAALAGSS
ncbi:MAG: 3-phosphoshikimate 1-carboxyvinyltransferase [Planctomycetes bacterium]|nr:3-phosphoshikimate 1-carboxyvinyltransferase [Planctomycetota bacterium]